MAPPLLIDTVVLQRPASVNASAIRKRTWKHAVRTAVEHQYGVGTLSPVTQDVVFSVGNYHLAGVPIDADNAIKVTQDALNALVYEDDVQVTDSLGFRRSQTALVTTDPMLVEALVIGQHFVRVRVSMSSDPHFQTP